MRCCQLILTFISLLPEYSPDYISQHPSQLGLKKTHGTMEYGGSYEIIYQLRIIYHFPWVAHKYLPISSPIPCYQAGGDSASLDPWVTRWKRASLPTRNISCYGKEMNPLGCVGCALCLLR